MSRRAIIAAAVTAALALAAGLALAHLRRADTAFRTAITAAAMPRLATPDGTMLMAAGSEAARRDLARRIGDAGAAASVRLSIAPLDQDIGGAVALHIVARGKEAELLRFSASVEHGPAPIRWTRWTILPDGDGELRLSADAAAPWRQPGTAPTANGPIVTLAAAQPSPLPATTIFAPSPITGETAAASAAPQLIGIVGRLPDDGVALLRLSDGSTRSLRRGEAADGWTVAAIDADRVRLSHDGRDHVAILPPAS